jgi:hypothetical protein
MITLLTAAALALCQEPLDELVDLLDSPDPEVRASARERLADDPARAAPLLEAALRRKGAFGAHELLSRIERESGPNRWISDQEMERAAKPDGTYPRARLDEAMALAKAEKYHDALRIVEALLILEPAGAVAADALLFRQGCRQRILQSDFVRLDASADLSRAAVGMTVRLDYTLRNVSHGDLTIGFGAGPGTFVTDLRLTMCEPLGGERVMVRALTAPLPPRIVIPRGKSHTVSLKLDTSEDLPKADVFRLYEAFGWFQPLSIGAGSMETAVRVAFPPVRVRVVPAAAAGFLRDPLFSFRQALDQGSMNDVFLCGMLLEPGPAQDEAVGKLVAELPGLVPAGRSMVGYLLGFMTGQRFGVNAGAWQAWWASKR